jgi:hypothetical protein
MFTKKVASEAQDLRTSQEELIQSIRGLQHAAWLNTVGQNLQCWRALLSEPRLADPRRLERFGHKCYSQNDEDGILLEIFNRIGVEHSTFIEFGVGNGLENNSLLWLVQGWRGLWIDGGAQDAQSIRARFADRIAARQLHFRQAHITAESIDQEFVAAGMTGGIDLLSIDIDGNDYYVFEAIRSVSARVVVIEYNGKFPPPVRWRMPYSPHHHWDGSDWFGASLQSMDDLFAARGYGLVACNITGANAFFVRNDLLGEGRFHAPYTAANHYQPTRYFLTGGLFQHIGGHPPAPGMAIVG